MCVSAIVVAAVAVATSAVGTYTSIRAANANARNERYKARIAQKQADEQREAARLQAMQQENARVSEFQRSRGAALAAIGASGLQEHISFNQGIDPTNDRALMNDVRAIRLNLVGQNSTLADQVEVADFAARTAKANAGAAKIGAFADFAASAMSAATFYSNVRTPTPAPKAA